MKNETKFEEALERLESIINKLEAGDAALDESLSLFEEGVALIKLCNEKLDVADRKVRILTEASDGTVTDMPFDCDEA